MRLFVLCSSQVNVGLGRRGELGLCHILVTPSRLRVWLPQASISPLRLVSPPKNFPLRTDAPLVSPPSSFGRLLHNFRDMVLISKLHLHLVSVFLFCFVWNICVGRRSERENRIKTAIENRIRQSKTRNLLRTTWWKFGSR